MAMLIKRFFLRLGGYRERERYIEFLERLDKERTNETVRLDAVIASQDRYIGALEGRDKERLAKIEKLEAEISDLLSTIKDMHLGRDHQEVT
jgi:uncharacterized protein (UPF0335 family)